MTELTPEKTSFICGRLMGLASTARYDVPDEMRKELMDLSMMLGGQEFIGPRESR